LYLFKTKLSFATISKAIKNKAMGVWKKRTTEQIKERVFDALRQNVNFYEENILGVPASALDGKVFPEDAPILKDAPFLSTLIHNPNHIGCHTLGDSEAFFAGTQELEREVIRICAEDILHGEPNAQDGYIASGGTEANMQAMWIYRNYFMREHDARPEEIVVIGSQDSHYSVVKGGNVLNIDVHLAEVAPVDRSILPDAMETAIADMVAQGKRYFIVVANMMTTMLGSVDDPDAYLAPIEKRGLPYRLHVDGAYGGFFYPFSNQQNSVLHFGNPKVSSVTLDAHKMVQAPYGTGIFLARKGLMKYVNTDQASYVKGLDATLVGSRSGANAVAVWMILNTYGPHGWYEKIQVLLLRTDWLARQLDERGIRYYRNPYSNIVTIYADDIDHELAHRFGLVPDSHAAPAWFKIVVMDHVTVDKLEPFIAGLPRVDALESSMQG